jgi:ABC-type multidrug transport system fused ATPase/permease subunit
MLVAMIYRKHSKISDATNKEFDQGEIVNFI